MAAPEGRASRSGDLNTTESETDRRPWGRRGTAGATIAARLTFESVSHDYAGVPSVREVSLDIAPGEIVCLLGRSGCGKTTLLRLAAGLERPSSGRVMIDGREVSGPTAFVAPEKRGVGLMFQDYALFPHLTILANVMFGLRDLPRKAAGVEARRVLGRVGLDAMVDAYPHTLSGGEQQRVALARAIVPRPAVLLMDEPFSGLDRTLREEVREETLAILRETRATSIIVTHDPEEAMRLGDRIGLMRDGRILQIGTADELYRRPVDLVAARFFSDINEFEGTPEAGAVTTPLGRINLNGKTPAGTAIVGLRPADIAVGAPATGVRGTVVARHFLGEVEHLDVAVEGVETPVRVRLRGGERFSVGEEVGMTINPAAALLFAKPDN
jgi:iron(III) transport system ATP-binding protein